LNALGIYSPTIGEAMPESGTPKSNERPGATLPVEEPALGILPEEVPRPDFLSAWKEAARRLKREVRAIYLAYRDPRVPWYARLFAGLVVAYAFSPIDLIPDPIPVLGYLDDLVLVPLGIALALRMIPPEVMAECRERVKQEQDEGKPVNWATAAVIVAIWIGMAALAIACVVRLLKR
jgi:uncharacterized membrane protein YkvA (DUF1232 family)